MRRQRLVGARLRHRRRRVFSRLVRRRTRRVLVAGGSFGAAGGIPAQGVAEWDGTFWRAVGGGIARVVYALQTFDDGTGPGIVAGGSFTFVSGITANRIARFDGSAWRALGSGLNRTVRQGIIADPGAFGRRPASVTNGVVVEAR